MNAPRVEVSAVVPGAAPLVYAILADYRQGHPLVLPRKYFSPPLVEEGGHGEGTLIRFEMRMLGATRAFRMKVSEPEPGRVLQETDVATGAATTFTVAPLDEATTRVTIATALAGGGGPLGWVQRRMASLVLRRIYAEELRILGDVARTRAATAGRH
jgi:hypothetical protein